MSKNHHLIRDASYQCAALKLDLPGRPYFGKTLPWTLSARSVLSGTALRPLLRLPLRDTNVVVDVVVILVVTAGRVTVVVILVVTDGPVTDGPVTVVVIMVVTAGPLTVTVDASGIVVVAAVAVAIKAARNDFKRSMLFSPTLAKHCFHSAHLC